MLVRKICREKWVANIMPGKMRCRISQRFKGSQLSISSLYQYIEPIRTLNETHKYNSKLYPEQPYAPDQAMPKFYKVSQTRLRCNALAIGMVKDQSWNTQEVNGIPSRFIKVDLRLDT